MRPCDKVVGSGNLDGKKHDICLFVDLVFGGPQILRWSDLKPSHLQLEVACHYVPQAQAWWDLARKMVGLNKQVVRH